MRKLIALLAFCCWASVLGAQSDTKVTGKKAQAPEVFVQAAVEERPTFVSGPTLVYPDVLRQAGVQGRVIVQAIIDTMGRAEPGSVTIVDSPNPGFNESARNYILGSLFRPGRVQGHAVRVLINVPMDYSIRPQH